MLKHMTLAVLFTSMSFKAPACPYFEEAARRNSGNNQKSMKSAFYGRADATEENFNRIIDDITGLYKEPLSRYSGFLQIKRDWESGTDNAYAMSFLGYWRLMFYGSLFRNPLMTDDAFALVVCHEIGHLLGGAPYYNGPGRSSVEGQADFWATSVCFKKYMTIAPARTLFKVDDRLRDRCDLQYIAVQDREICYRTAQASMDIASFFNGNAKRDLLSSSEPLTEKTTYQGHPIARCRLDTYLAGSFCVNEESSDERMNRIHKSRLVTSSLCLDEKKELVEKRPGCWFHPYNNELSIIRVYSKNSDDRKYRVIYKPHLAGEYTLTLKPNSDKIVITNPVVVQKFKLSDKAKDLDFYYRFSRPGAENKDDFDTNYTLTIEKEGSKIYSEEIKGWPMMFETER